MKTFMISPVYEEAGGGAGGTGAAPWYGTPEPEVLGYLQARGLDKMEPKDAALAAVNFHREAEKLIGAPAEQLIRLPKDAADVDGWNKVHAKLGVPADAKEYDFATLKYTDGSTMKETEIEELRTLAVELKLPKATAALLGQKLMALNEKAESGKSALHEGELAQEKDKLAQNWGHNAAVNQVVADNAMLKLGITEEQKEALKGVIGYSAVMEMFRDIGTKIGEDRFVRGGPNNNGVMTKDEASAKLESLRNDSEWFKRYTSGDPVAAKEFNDLTRIQVGV